MEHNFEYISYIHISRRKNQIIDALTNFLLNWHINHQVNESSHTHKHHRKQMKRNHMHIYI